MNKIDQLLKTFSEFREQLSKSDSEAANEELMKSMDNLRAQMRQNTKKKARQKEEQAQVAQSNATTIKQGGNLRSNPDDTFKPNSTKNLGSSNKPKPKSNDDAISTPADYSKEQYDKHISGNDPDRKRQALMSEHSTKEHTEEALAHKNPMIRNAAIQSKYFTKEHADHMEANETNNHVRLNAVRKGKEVSKPSLSVVKADYEKDMSIKGKRGVREERRISNAKAKTPRLSTRLQSFKDKKSGDKFKSELIKALDDAGYRESALLLSNWNEVDANAETMSKSMDKAEDKKKKKKEDDKDCGMPESTCDEGGVDKAEGCGEFPTKRTPKSFKYNQRSDGSTDASSGTCGGKNYELSWGSWSPVESEPSEPSGTGSMSTNIGAMSRHKRGK